MKKLLFFGYTLEIGGAEKVLVDFLNVLKDEYEMDLVLLQAKGDFLKDVPQSVSVHQIRNHFFSYLLFRYIPYFRKKKINQIANQKDYDVAIGFFEGRSATWVADIQKDIRRVAWVHNDVTKYDIGIGEKEIKDSYAKMDEIVVVSEEAKASFIQKYSMQDKKVTTLHNMIDEQKIQKMAEETVSKNEKFTFVNVGKMRPQKRQDRLIEIASRLKQDGYSFELQMIGNGPEEEKLRKMAEEKKVTDVVNFLGLKKNPYPYVKQADCFVLSSDFEGYVIAVKEALILKTPVISTNVTGAKELLGNAQYGILCDVDTQAIYEAMKQVLEKPETLQKFREELLHYDGENEEIIQGLKNIIENKR